MTCAYTSLLSILAILIGGVSLSHAVVRSVSTASQLQSALGSAVAGDEIVLKDGIYTGQFTISGNSGTASAPITVRAENKHNAILENVHSCASSAEAKGLTISRSHWIVQNLRFRKQQRAVQINAANVTFRYNIVEDFDENGIDVRGVSNVTIDSNVIAYGTACVTNRDDAGIYLVTNADKNIVRNNIIVATGNNGYQAGGNMNGYGIQVANNSDDNLVQGNLLLANGGKGVFRILAGSTVTADRNIIRDNAFLHGEGGVSSSDCRDHANQFINNLSYGVYYVLGSTKGNWDGTRGQLQWRNNLLYANEFTRLLYGNAGGGCGGEKIDNVFKDNVVYQTYQPNTSHALMWIGSESKVLPTSLNPGYNVFWAPGSMSSWFRNYTLRSKDIAAQPTFVNPAAGDFSLASGSPGKGAASNGKDIGIEYNQYLKKSWLKNAFALPTQQKDNLSTSASFTVDPNKYYQVWFYIPEPACGCVETFKVEGQSLSRDISLLTNGTWTMNGSTQRWITLGRHRATDGTLNISWSNSASASKIFIRQLPTSDQSYQWIAQTQNLSEPLLAPTNLRVVENP